MTWVCVSNYDDFAELTRGMYSGNLITRVWHEGSVLPGYVSIDQRCGYYSHNGNFLMTEDDFDFDAMNLNSRIRWEFHKEGEELPRNALVAGATPDYELYIGSIRTCWNEMLYGQVHKDGKCFIASISGVMPVKTFYIATYNIENEN
ncbi:Hypothetical predicted protein [Cloeon dipterum]|uniref:Uncharacterized protein n=1 Tax=Cloeon dipterum TaxID=197152 RepID=A0A8S1DYI0_9INSE|nr:Hypothetical predicted protein [Cloeon dipterum]